MMKRVLFAIRKMREDEEVVVVVVGRKRMIGGGRVRKWEEAKYL
jgi:hypothetical protein